MTPIAMLTLYLGVGLALALLRLNQGRNPLDCLLAVLAWPLDLAGNLLLVLDDRLRAGQAAACDAP